MKKKKPLVFAALLIVPMLAVYRGRGASTPAPAGMSGHDLAPTTSEPCVPPTPDAAPLAFGDESLIAVCRDAYVDRAIADRERVKHEYAEARYRVAAALDGVRGERPLAIFCASSSCKRYFAGTSRRSMSIPAGGSGPGALFVAERRTIVVVDGPPATEDAITHEMVHAEVAERVRSGLLPAWFHEGLATRISGSPDCSDVGVSGIHDLADVAANRAWVEHTSHASKLRPTYCQARGEVAAWEKQHGRAGLLALFEAIRHGADFAEIYGPRVLP